MVAIAAGAILLLAWIGWAVYVTSKNGAAAGLGVVIAWPLILAALALIALPFIGLYLLIRRLGTDSGAAENAPAAGPEPEEEPEADGDADESEEDGDDSEESNGESEEDSEAGAEKAAG
jgi:flagellar biosynthesis/type III secretory pathway M-ring protein FliF/YscJ